MGIYRADPQHGVAWVTGASTGIGRALSLALARDGFTVAATALDSDEFETLVREAAGLKGKIVPFPCDVTDEAGMAATVAGIEKGAGPIVLAVFNAGIYQPARGEALTVSPFRQVYAVNLLGVVNGLVPTLAAMRPRGRGQVVLTGSITSFFGWPHAAAYSSSKSALNRMAESLRFDLVKINIRIQVVNPGFVNTPLTSGMDTEMPAVMPVEKAAARILRAIQRGGFETSFPRRVAWVLKLIACLPAELRFRIIYVASRWSAQPLQPSPKIDP